MPVNFSKMKRYIVFAYPQYDLGNPISCILASFDDLEQAKSKLINYANLSPDENYGEILDCETMQEVFSYHKWQKLD